MASTYLNSQNMALIERLLAEVRPDGTEPTSPLGTTQARLLVAACEQGMDDEQDLRRLLAESMSEVGTKTTFISVMVREALGTMLEGARQRDGTYSVSDAVETIRSEFPDLQVSDAELIEAIAGEAATTGVDLDFDVLPLTSTGSLERWDNEGGAIKKAPTESEKREARRRGRNDTDGSRRRANEVKSRNQMF